jgi:hypothetical protein
LTSPPQEQKNFWVALEVREFLLAWAMAVSLSLESPQLYTRKNSSVNTVFFLSSMVSLLEKIIFLLKRSRRMG